MKLTKVAALPSLCRTRDKERENLTIAVAQLRWEADPSIHQAKIRTAAELASSGGAQVLMLPELTLSRYPADARPESHQRLSFAEDLLTGATTGLLRELALSQNIWIVGSLFERNSEASTGGYNTAVLYSPAGEIAGFNRKLHIPVTEGYFEDEYFTPGPPEGAKKVHELPLPGEPRVGMPTCWDEWFPELARDLALAGADVLCYPTAIGSEPDHPDFDTSELLLKTVTGHAIANGLFIAIPNRWGDEGRLNFYGKSFVVDPFGRTLARAGSDTDELLVVELDLNQRRDWLELFPFFATRRPDSYASLVMPVENPRQPDGRASRGGIPGIRPW